jgi:hypothetical protein
LQVALDGGHVAEPSGLEPVNEIAACQDDHRMPVFTDFAVSLGVEMRGSDQDPELAVPEPRDEPTRFAHTHAVRWGVALGFQRKLDRDWVGVWAKQILSDRVPASIAPGRPPCAAR